MTSIWTWAPLPARTVEGKRISFEAWSELSEDEPGELVDGRLEEEEMADAVHELAVSWLIAVFRGWLAGRGFVLGSEIKLAISADRGRKPDLAVYFPERSPPGRKGPLTEPPDIVIEIVTPTPRDERRDRVDKMNDYAAFGVASYWILDPALGTLEVFLLDESRRYVKAVGRTDGVIDPVPGCPGLEIDLGALWAELERLA